MSKIIILRGNSGSGKSTVAKTLQQKFGSGTLLISQDDVRRKMLLAFHGLDWGATALLKNLVTFGSKNHNITILEGVLFSHDCNELFAQIIESFGSQIFAYYFDIPFEETLKRHKQRQINGSHNFDENKMKEWWHEKDFIKKINETILDKDMTLDVIISNILKDINCTY